MSEELENFKRNINLAEYAASKGYVVDKRKSSKRSIIMRRGSEKIGIGINRRTGDQNYNNFSSGHGGTIIDFAKDEGFSNLGFIRKELRKFLGSPKPQVKFARPIPRLSKREQAAGLQQEWSKAIITKKSVYLESRGIFQNILNNPLFRGKVYTDLYNNALFPHLNKYGFCGFEKKNYSFTSFSTGGEKALWYSNNIEGAEKIVVCESAIDCMSHATLHLDNRAVYVSTAGQLSHDQEQALVMLINNNPDKTIVAAFDNDEAGQKYAEDLQGLTERHIEIDVPVHKDWNEDLQESLEHEQNFGIRI